MNQQQQQIAFNYNNKIIMAKCNLAIWHQYNRKVTPKKHLICGLSLCVTFLLLYCDCILIIFKQFFLALNTTLPFLINKSTGTMQASLKKIKWSEGYQDGISYANKCWIIVVCVAVWRYIRSNKISKRFMCIKQTTKISFLTIICK